jgi:adenine-specific DNA-methyltransferase
VDEHGPYVARRNLDNPGKPGYDYDIEHPVTKKPCKKPQWGWRYPEDKMRDLISGGRIIFGKDENKLPELKVYLEEVDFPLRSVIDDIDARAGSNDLERLFGTRDRFKNPKPVALIQRLLDYSTPPEALVLDPFAGSGTTGEAVLRLNSRDGGRRRFILIEEGEAKRKFCRTLTAERMRLAIQKDGYDGGFTFYATGRKLDRNAIIGLERDALANLICQADETGRGRGITRLNGQTYQYVIGKNYRSEAICLVWNGNVDSEVTPERLQEAAKEVTAAGLKRPFRIYGTFCRVADVPTSFKFCQIPDEILAQMHIREDLGDEV